jgi:hypothetical protein
MNKGQLHLVDAQKEYYFFPDDVLFCSADGNYCDIYMVQHTIYKSIRIQLGQLWKKIEEKGKVIDHHLERIGRSYIINMKHIGYVNPQKGELILQTDKNVKLKIPKAAAKELVKFVGKRQEKQVVTVYADKRKLTIGRHQLNDDMSFEKGRMYVDLGLPSGTMWATMNVGEGGLFLEPYYAWGALSEYNTYSKIRYDHRTSKENLTDGTSLNIIYDIARQQWGGRWRMPTLDNFRELVDECVMTWCTLGNRRRAILVTGPNGNKIILPVVGYYKNDEIRDDRFQAYYWTNTLYKDDPERAWAIFFGEEDDSKVSVFNRIDPRERFQGLCVRPVFHPKEEVEDEKPQEKKKVVIFHEYFPDYSYDNSDEYPHAAGRTCLKGSEWIVFEKSLPLNPEAGLEEVKKFCGIVQPDIIVGITTACTFLNQMTAYERVMIDPTCTASDKLRDHIEMGLNPGDTDERTKREELINKFKEFENQHQFVASDKQCWVALHQKAEQEVDGCRYVKLPDFNVLARWRRVFLYPLLLKVRKNEPQVKLTVREAAERLKEITYRISEAGKESNKEVDDEF